jgi:hypothetical protein
MLAIIKTGGKQFIVKPGDKLKIEKLIGQLFNHGARINHRLFIGDEEAKKSALIAHQEELAHGKAAYFIGELSTMTPSCEQHHQILSSKLYDRWYSLLINPTVESIIIHVYDDELIEMGLPIDQIEQYSIINNQIQFNKTSPKNHQEAWSQLIELFELHSTV